MTATSDAPDRRAFLLGAAAVVVSSCTRSGESVAGTPVGATAAPGPSVTEAETATTAATVAPSDLEALTPAMFDEVSSCIMTPTSTSGPFPNRAQLDRRVIHENMPGHPLRLGVRVVDARCVPVIGAAVVVWHTDASGDYSEYEDGGSGKDEGEGSTFCRGQQMVDGDGIAEFETIYPGWYEGRAVHIHVMVTVDGQNIYTGQLYFDEAYSEAIYQTGAYVEFGPPDTPWSVDGIVGDPATDGTGLALSESVTGLGPGTLGLVVLGVPADAA